MKKTLPLLFCLSLFLLWELMAAFSHHLTLVLPSPSSILTTLWELKARFFFHTIVTLKEMLIGFLLAALFAFPLAWTMLRYQLTRSILQPLFVVIQCVPMFALAPIMVILFGWTAKAIIIPTALMIFFPLTLNTYQGLRATPKPLLDFFASNQATGWQTFYKLRLPYALPSIFAGLRISSAIAGVGAVAGEWAGAQQGLGVLMLESRRHLDLEITFGALFCLIAISMLLYGTVLIAERLPRRLKIIFGQRSSYKRFLSMALVTFSLLLSSCQKECSETRLLLDWLPNPNHIPLYVGIDKGFFREEGIDLQIQKLSENGGGLSYLSSSQADLAVSHLPSTLKASAKGAKLKIVGQLVDQSLRSLIYLKDGRVVEPKDLSGKVFGYCIGGPATTFLDLLLSRAAIQPIAHRNVSVDMIGPLAAGEVDFIYGGYWNIEPHLIRSLGVETDYFTFEQLHMPPYQELIIVAREGSIESSSAFASNFQKALQKSIDYARAHAEEAFSIYLKHNPDRSKRTIDWEYEAWKETAPLFCKNQEIDFSLIDRYTRWLLHEGILKRYPTNLRVDR